MNRRGFLASCLALGAAPAIVRADSLMRIVPRDTAILAPTIYDLSENGRHLYLTCGWNQIREVIVFDQAHDAEKRDRILRYLAGQPAPTDFIAANSTVAWYRSDH